MKSTLVVKRSVTDPLRLEQLFSIFILAQIIIWTLTPFLVRYALPMDALEGTIWGQNLSWGYDKNPFLNGWLTELAVLLDNHAGWGVYLFSQISVVICFWSVWELGKRILNPTYALIAVMLLEGVQYFTVHSIDFNDNVLELALWALIALFFYRALRTIKFLDWSLTGIFAALGMMAKYYTVILLFPMFIFMFAYKENRKHFFHAPFYMGIVFFTAIVTPHVVWLFSHDFITVNYAIGRVESSSHLLNHFSFAAWFIWQQVYSFSPPLILLYILTLGEKPKLTPDKFSISTFDKQFLFYIAIAPFILTVLLSVICGIHLRAGWGEPLLSLWGIVLLAWLQPQITQKKFFRFTLATFILMIVIALGYAVAMIRADRPSSANFPARVIANTLTHAWHTEFHTALPYVAGTRWIAGNVAYYSTDHPNVFINWDKKESPWINTKTLRQQGAIFIWNAKPDDDEKLPAEIKKRFPNLTPFQVMHFTWLRNRTLDPVEIRVAMLPPAHQV